MVPVLQNLGRRVDQGRPKRIVEAWIATGAGTEVDARLCARSMAQASTGPNRRLASLVSRDPLMRRLRVRVVGETGSPAHALSTMEPVVCGPTPLSVRQRRSR